MARPNIFNSIKVKRMPKNVFDLSHDKKLSLKAGGLYPVMVMECVPGDKVQLGCECMVRMAPMTNPVMHRMDVYIHYWFIPNRLVWENWEDFITGTGTPPAFPTVDMNEVFYTPLCNYMGIPTPRVPGPNIIEPVNAIPFAAYQMVYNEMYRDQNLVPEVPFALVNGDNTSNAELTELRIRAWEHDYFTSALPFAQKGQPVKYPLAVEDFEVSGLTNVPGDVGNDIQWDITSSPNPVDYPTGRVILDESSVVGGANGKLFVKGENVVGTTLISDLRRAFKLQEFLELDARGGTRYSEMIYAHFGVKSPDARLQRPEYITGMSTPMMISEVVNTAGFDNGTDSLPQGNMAGHGISVGEGNYGSYYCQEHGFIIGIMSMRPKTAYQDGIEKQWLKTVDRYQYYWNEFAHIGEQEVLNREVYCYTLSGGDTFGYVPRYAEYKFMNSQVCGDFRDSLDSWHWGRIFGSQPALNQSFIECLPDQRIFAVTGPEDYLYAHVLHKVRATRSMPRFGNPGI